MAVRATSERPDFSRLGEAEILRHLHVVGPEDFEDLLQNPAFHHRHLIALLRNPSLPQAVLKRICDDDEMISHYRVKAVLVLHPNTPRVAALEMLRHLFWRDLLQVTESARVHPQIRRTAEHLLEEQMDSLKLGEKLSLARLAGRSVIRILRKEQDPSVASVLLNNSRLTEEDVIFMVTRSGVRPDILRTVGRSRRWSQRYPVRLGLVRNVATPPSVSLGLLTGLLDRDLTALAGLPTLPDVVRRTAQRILREGRTRR